MKTSYWDKASVSERRREVRLEGKCLENVESAVRSANSQEGWDQPIRILTKMSNLSAGGLEVEVAASFPFAVDTSVVLELRFGGESDWLSVPAIVRHIHFVEQGSLVGMQFRWNDSKETDLEYRLCEHLLRLERRGT